MPNVELAFTPWILIDGNTDFNYWVTWDFTYERWFDVRPVALTSVGHNDLYPTTLEVVRRWSESETAHSDSNRVWQQIRNLSPAGSDCAFRMAVVRTALD